MNPSLDNVTILPIVPVDQNPYADRIAEIETELDRIFGASRPKGGWRRKEPFHTVEVGLLHRLKVLLKRRDLLLRARDWEVALDIPDPRNPRKCFARPVMSRHDAPPPPVLPSASEMAFALRVPVEQVEAAIERAPAACKTDAAGLRGWVEAVCAATAGSPSKESNTREAHPEAAGHSRQ